MSATTTLRMILLGDDRSAGKALKGVGSEADKTTTKMDKFHKVGHAAGIALASGLVLAGKAAVDMTKKAAEDQASAARLAQSLHKAAGATDAQVASTEKWISAQEKAFGVSDEDLRPALSKLAVATGSVAKAQKLASLAMDVSAGTGRSLSSVSLALAKAQNGNISGLGRLGIATKDAAGNTLTLKQVTQQLTDHYSGAASAAAQTVTGKQKILTVQMQELQEQIGYKLLPVMLQMVDVGLRVIKWVSRNTKLVGIMVGVIGGLVAITWAVSAATKAWSAATTIASLAMKIFTRQTEEADAALVANPIGIVVVALIALTAALIYAYKHSATFRKIVDGALRAIGAAGQWMWNSALRPAFSALGSAMRSVGAVARWLWNNAFQPSLHAIVSGIATLVNIWGHMLSALGHIPGFGWAKDAGAALQAAADKAQHLADNINKIPSHKTATVVLNTIHNVVHTTGGHVPAMAEGGIVRRPTIALIGEAGPEAVVPLSRAGSLGGGGDVNVYVTASGLVDPSTMAGKIQTELLKLKRTRGNVALGLS